MAFIRKFSLEILTFIMFAMVTFTAAVLQEVSITRRFLVLYMFLLTLHEWEENRYPGGFSDLMSTFLGIKFDEKAEQASRIPVAVLLIVITLVPYIFDSVVFLVLIPVCLGIFEGFIHVVGIKIHNTKKPYTPGLITSLCMLAISIYAVYYFADNNITNGKDYLLGIICLIVGFAIMQKTVFSINGLSYRDLLKTAKKKLNR